MTPEAKLVAELVAMLGVVDNPCLDGSPDSGLSPGMDLLMSSLGTEGCFGPKKSLRGDCILDLLPLVHMLVQNAGLFMNVTRSVCEDRNKVFIYIKIKLFVRRG